ncbi:hypothetical protein BH11ARM2_BH11ARM2_32770 [soil metagenome]
MSKVSYTLIGLDLFDSLRWLYFFVLALTLIRALRRKEGWFEVGMSLGGRRLLNIPPHDADRELPRFGPGMGE